MVALEFFFLHFNFMLLLLVFSNPSNLNIIVTRVTAIATSRGTTHHVQPCRQAEMNDGVIFAAILIPSAAMQPAAAYIAGCFIPFLLFIMFQTIQLNFLIPCLPDHLETDSEESNGGPLVINPLPADSSLSFGLIIGIPLMSLPETLKSDDPCPTAT